MDKFRRPAGGAFAEAALVQQDSSVSASDSIYGFSHSYRTTSDNDNIPRVLPLAGLLQHLISIHVIGFLSDFQLVRIALLVLLTSLPGQKTFGVSSKPLGFLRRVGNLPSQGLALPVQQP